MKRLTIVRKTTHDPNKAKAADKVLLGRIKELIHSDSLMVQRTRDLGLLYNHYLGVN